MFCAAILLSAFALHNIQAAPTLVEVDVDVTLRIEDHIGPHHTTSIPETLYIASIGSRDHPHIIIEQGRSDTCERRVTLPEDDICEHLFSIAGMDDLVLKGCGIGELGIYRGDILHYFCIRDDGYPILCSDHELFPVFMCYTPRGDLTAANQIVSHPAKKSVVAHRTTAPVSFFLGGLGPGQSNVVIGTDSEL